MGRANEFEEDIRSSQMAAQSGIRELLARHEAKVLKRAISEYRGGEMSGEAAKIAIAVIAELRLLGGDVERTIERGRTAVK